MVGPLSVQFQGIYFLENPKIYIFAQINLILSAALILLLIASIFSGRVKIPLQVVSDLKIEEASKLAGKIHDAKSPPLCSTLQCTSARQGTGQPFW